MRLDWQPIDLRLRQTFRIARGASDGRRNLLLRAAEGPEGPYGLGEVIPYLYYGQTLDLAESLLPAARAFLADQPVPASASEVAALVHAFATALARQGHGPRQANHVLCALECALLDLVGKTRGVPLMDLLDGVVPPEVARHREFPLTSFTLGIAEPDEMRRKAEDAREFQVLKIKLGQGLTQDQDIIRAVRSCTDRPLRVDANCGWDLRTTLAMAEFLRQHNVEYIEQPLPPQARDDYAVLRRESPLPIYLDESVVTLEDVESAGGAAHGVNLKLSKCGGPLTCLTLMRQARLAGLHLMLGCMIESSVGIGFAAHLSAFVDHADLDGNLLTSNDPFASQGNVVVQAGRVVEVRRAPGLGVPE